MKRFKITKPDKVDYSSTYVVNHIIPLCIKERDNDTFSILFLIQSNIQDEEVKDYIVMFFSYDDMNDKIYIKNHHLNQNNIKNNPRQLKLYKEMIDQLSSGKLYSTDLDLVQYEDKKIFYSCNAYHESINGETKELTLLFSKSLFIQINLFFMRFSSGDMTAETAFVDPTLHKIDFVKLQSIKLDGSAKPAPGSMYVSNHYTAKAGPNTYKFHFLSAALMGRRFKNPMGYQPYCSMYDKDPLIDQMFMDTHTDTLYIIYIERNVVDNSYKRTIALKLSKELYDHTNFLDIYKIYENDNK